VKTNSAGSHHASSPFDAGFQTPDPPNQIRSAESAFQTAQQLIK
jgi:hypothetical protein